jgi:hypothetical protein
MKLLERRLRMTPAELVAENQRMLDKIEELRIAATGVFERARRLRRMTAQGGPVFTPEPTG